MTPALPLNRLRARSGLPGVCWLLLSLFILYGAVIPFHFAPSGAFALAKLSQLPLNPLVSPESGERVSIPDFVQNVLLFLPFGFLGVVVLRQRRFSTSSRVVLVAALGGLLSGVAETLQLFTIDRTASVSDLTADMVGALAGALAAEGLFSQAASRPAARLRQVGLTAAPAFYPLMVAAAVLCIAAWEPFDVSLDASGIWHKLTALRSNPWQSDAPGGEVLGFLRYLLFTVLARSWLRQLGVGAADTIAAVVGAAAVVALEGSQIVIESRLPGLVDASAQLAGVLAAATLIRARVIARIRSPKVWCVLLGIATWIGMAIQLLSPFTIAASRRPLEWLPFAVDDQHPSLLVLSRVIQLALMCFPVGFSIPLIVRKRSQILIDAAASGFCLAFPLEFVQGWIVGRHPSITDIGASILGCVAGAWAGGDGWAYFRSHHR